MYSDSNFREVVILRLSGRPSKYNLISQIAQEGIKIVSQSLTSI